IGKMIPNAAIRDNLVPGKTQLIEATDASGAMNSFAIAPAQFQGHSVFYVVIGQDHQELAAPAQRMLWMSVLALVSMVLLSLVGTWIFATRLLIEPVRRVIAAAQKVAGGDLHVRTSLPHSADELGQLAFHFDQMATAL